MYIKFESYKYQIFVDDKLIHSKANDNTIPFNKDFFLIFNVAMGGTFGGAIVQPSVNLQWN
jgi:hypothetical protein